MLKRRGQGWMDGQIQDPLQLPQLQGVKEETKNTGSGGVGMGREREHETWHMVKCWQVLSAAEHPQAASEEQRKSLPGTRANPGMRVIPGAGLRPRMIDRLDAPRPPGPCTSMDDAVGCIFPSSLQGQRNISLFGDLSSIPSTLWQ